METPEHARRPLLFRAPRPAFPIGPSRPRLLRSLAPFFLALLLAGLPSCGYSLQPLQPPGIRTVHVPLFENESRRREIEFALTEAVARELRREGWRIAGPGSCDAVLRGRILEVREEALSLDTSGAVSEGRLTVAVEYRLERPGGEAVSSGRAEEAGEAVYARGEDRAAGLDRALAEVARAVVRGLERPRR